MCLWRTGFFQVSGYKLLYIYGEQKNGFGDFILQSHWDSANYLIARKNEVKTEKIIKTNKNSIKFNCPGLY